MATGISFGKTRPDTKLRVVDRWLDQVDVYEMTLDEYYESVIWGAKKLSFAQEFPDASCFVCGRRDYQLHHLRYDRLGQEAWDEFIPLCPDHLYEVEKHIAKGLPGVTRENAHLEFVRPPTKGATHIVDALYDAFTAMAVAAEGGVRPETGEGQRLAVELD
jgi:hypothetical protein